MKVVIFCGGLGTRLREHSDTIPKALVTIGHRPILWHLMRYYAHYGHKDFVLCLGYRGDLIRDYFLHYREEMTSDFRLTLSSTGISTQLLHREAEDWNITFVDTGMHSNIGQRLLRVRQYLAGEPAFLANYADGLSDIPIDEQYADFKRRNVVGSFAAVHSSQSLHTVHTDAEGYTTRIGEMTQEPFWINGGYFIFKQEIFDYIREGEELVMQPFERLIAARQLTSYQWTGFWQCMDTFKDKITYDRMEAQGNCPWMRWRTLPQAHRG